MSELLPDQLPDGWNRTSSAYDDNAWDFVAPYVEEVVTRAGIRPEDELLERIGADGEAKLREELLAMLRPRFGDGPVRLSNEAHIGTGIAG